MLKLTARGTLLAFPEELADALDTFRISLVIPNLSDQYPLAQFRSPIDMIFQGWSVSLFQAWQQWSTKLS